MITKRKLKAQIMFLESTLRATSNVAAQLERKLDNVREERDEWRAKYELMYHTPEFKADTEAAFARGADKMKTSLIAWLMQVNATSHNDDWKVEGN